jgi:shikimate kinase
MEKDKKKPNKADKEFVKNTVEINPKLNEEVGKTVVIAWGRMNPVTSGHEKLVNKVKTVARQNKADVRIFLSHSQDPKKNPLSYEDKIELARKAFGNIIYKSTSKTIIDVMKELQKSYQNVILVAGSDRVPQFKELLNKYNGKDYNFNSIEVVSAGERDPDADDVSGMSASKLRALAIQGDKDAFKKGLPSRLRTQADSVYALVRTGMRLAEGLEAEEDLQEAVLTIQQRLKRARTMRRIKSRLKVGRKKAQRRMANTEKLQKRARKRAIELIRKKVAGSKGASYSSLSAAEKIQIDKRIESRKGAIDRLAKRLLPTVRRAEAVRFRQQSSSGPMAQKKMNEMFDVFIEGSNYYTGLKKSTAAKRKAHFNKYKEYDDDNPAAYKKAPGDATAKTKPSVHTKRYHQMFSDEAQMKFDRRFKINKKMAEMFDNDEGIVEAVEEIVDSIMLEEAKAMDGLKKKAEKSGMPYGILKKVYDRGVAAWRTGHRPGTTPQQWGYARVNSFVTKSSGTWGKADSDLAAKVRSEAHIHPHVLDPNVPLKHQISKKHTRVDLDQDGDVDKFDKTTPADIVGTEKNIYKKMMKKYAGEKEHSKKHIAYESVDEAFDAFLDEGLFNKAKNYFSNQSPQARRNAAAAAGAAVVKAQGHEKPKSVKHAFSQAINHEHIGAWTNKGTLSRKAVHDYAAKHGFDKPEHKKELDHHLDTYNKQIGGKRPIVSESVDLDEGVNDPSIFKAVFLAGGPGSGKSFIVGKTALTALGFKIVNSDAAFEIGLKNAGMEMSPENIYSPKGQEIRGRAKAITKSMMQNYINGRLGLVIDGTGKDYAKIEKQAKMLRELGYEVAMIFVNTDLDTALERNRMRSRSLPDEQVEAMWKDVQKNLGKFQNFFRQKMFIVDNSTGANYEGAVMSTYKRISAWSKTKPASPAAKKWMDMARGVSEAMQDPQERMYNHALDALKKVIDRKKKEGGDKGLRHSSMYYAGQIARGYSGLDAKKLHAMLEEHGAGEEGTDKLKNKYKKDTPGQNVNEAFESLLEQDTCDLVSMQQMKAFEKFVDRMFEKYNIDFQFTKHFGDRMGDDRNNPCIKMKELADFISKIYKRQGKSLKAEAGAEAVIKDMQSDLNIPVVVKYDQKNDEFDVVMKTIMRKKNFSTPNKIIKY